MKIENLFALTGPPACGKSTAAKYFLQHGFEIIEADNLARDVVSKGTEGLREVIKVLGQEYLNEDQTLNRRKAAEAIFSSEPVRRRVEDVIHPRVQSTLLQRVSEIRRKSPHTPILYVVPLLFEGKMDRSIFTRTITILCRKEDCLRWAASRDELPPSTLESRFNAHLSPEIKAQLSDYVIKNESTPEAFKLATEEVIELLKSDFRFS